MGRVDASPRRASGWGVFPQNNPPPWPPLYFGLPFPPLRGGRDKREISPARGEGAPCCDGRNQSHHNRLFRRRRRGIEIHLWRGRDFLFVVDREIGLFLVAEHHRREIVRESADADV